MQRIGSVEDAEMFRTFNMGIGMVIVCAEENASRIKTDVESSGSACYQIGSVIRGSGEVAIT
jgi:phosphoribosylformylglycinamidine cyclo-ligase